MSIPFDEIVQGSTVRLTTDSLTLKGVQTLCIRDLIMHLCNTNGDYGLQIWRNLDEGKKNELRQYISEFKFPGQGQRLQPVISFPGAIKLAMFLPGDNAARNRGKMVGILQRYFAGDPSMLEEIQANAASSNPVCEMAREALASGSGDKRPASSLEESVRDMASDAGVLVKRMREMSKAAGGVQPTVALMKVDMEAVALSMQASADAMEKIFGFKKQCFDLEVRGRAREMEDASRRAELDQATRAREREDIVAKARADAEAIAIVAEARRKAEAPPAPPAPPAPYPNVADFLPDDYTTVEKVYNENKGLHVKKSDKSKHLNEAKLNVLRLYRTEFNGANPRRVICEYTNRLVEMYPKDWTGLKAELVNLLRHKKGGFGQVPISSCFAPNSQIHIHMGGEGV